jgi:hypothetical protein
MEEIIDLGRTRDCLLTDFMMADLKRVSGLSKRPSFGFEKLPKPRSARGTIQQCGNADTLIASGINGLEHCTARTAALIEPDPKRAGLYS